MIWRIAEFLADGEQPQPQPPADNRIERALQVLRNACDEGDDSFDGWDLVRQGIKILEGGSDD
jgi:hypothetical protein